MFINKSFYKYNILILIYFLNGKLEKPTKNYFSMFTAFYKKPLLTKLNSDCRKNMKYSHWNRQYIHFPHAYKKHNNHGFILNG